MLLPVLETMAGIQGSSHMSGISFSAVWHRLLPLGLTSYWGGGGVWGGWGRGSYIATSVLELSMLCHVKEASFRRIFQGQLLIIFKRQQFWSWLVSTENPVARCLQHLTLALLLRHLTLLLLEEASNVGIFPRPCTLGILLSDLLDDRRGKSMPEQCLLHRHATLTLGVQQRSKSNQ